MQPVSKTFLQDECIYVYEQKLFRLVHSIEKELE